LKKREEGKGDDIPAWLKELFHRGREEGKVLAKNPLYLMLRKQKIRLKENGAEMTWGEAQDQVESLRRIQTDPDWADAWTALLALIKPRAAKQLPSTIPHKGLVELAEVGELHNGVVDPICAFVLDASLTVTEDGQMVLRDPVAYTKEFIEKWGPLEEKVQGELDRVEDRLDAEKAAKDRRKKRGRGEGSGPER